jgi:NHL repeat
VTWLSGPEGGGLFQPLADGRASKDFVVFADGFAGAVKEPGQAAHRPSGLAVGPDGSLYISDDSHGRIWRVTFRGEIATTGIAPAPAPRIESAAASPNVGPPEGIHPNAGAEAPILASRHRGTACARRAGIPRPSRWRNVRGLSRIERTGHAAGARPHQRQMAVGRWQSRVDRGHHR